MAREVQEAVIFGLDITTKSGEAFLQSRGLYATTTDLNEDKAIAVRYYHHLVDTAHVLKPFLTQAHHEQTEETTKPLKILQKAARSTYQTIRSKVIAIMLQIDHTDNNSINPHNIIPTTSGFLYPIPGNKPTAMIQQLLVEAENELSTSSGIHVRLNVKAPPTNHDPTKPAPAARIITTTNSRDPQSPQNPQLTNHDITATSHNWTSSTMQIVDSGQNVALYEKNATPTQANSTLHQ